MPRSCPRPEKHPCDVHGVAGRVGIRILKPAQRRGDGRARECFCPRTLKTIGQAHGEGHLELVLRLIVETEGNAFCLQGDTITAVSAAVRSGLVQVGGDLFDAFDVIDLGMLRTWAQAVKGKATTDEVMTTVILWLLASPEKLFPPRDPAEIAADEERRRIARNGRENARRRRLARYAGDDRPA